MLLCNELISFSLVCLCSAVKSIDCDMYWVYIVVYFCALDMYLAISSCIHCLCCLPAHQMVDLQLEHSFV